MAAGLISERRKPAAAAAAASPAGSDSDVAVRLADLEQVTADLVRIVRRLAIHTIATRPGTARDVLVTMLRAASAAELARQDAFLLAHPEGG